MGFFIGREGEAGEDNWFQEEPKEYSWFSEVAEDVDEMAVEDPPAYPRNPSRR